MAAAREDADLTRVDRADCAVAVELDLVRPAIAGQRVLAQQALLGLDETRQCIGGPGLSGRAVPPRRIPRAYDGLARDAFWSGVDLALRDARPRFLLTPR